MGGIVGAIRGWFRLAAGTVAGALAAAVVPALPAWPAGAAGPGAVRPITWHRCPAGSAAAQAGGFSCATVAVPLDYQNPAGPKIKLAVVRHAATRPRRRGVIFVNPAGPGGPGTVQIPAWLGFWPRALLRGYDIVSWDPRGIGASTAVRCFPSQAAENAFLGKYANFPAGRHQQRGYIRRWRAFGKICAARSGRLLRHVSTADTARDLNALRRALRQPELDYLGLSYGTFLGATYANLFPRHVGRLVLDGNVAPTAWTGHRRPHPRLSISLRMGSDTEAAETLTAFLRICGQRSTRDCAFSAGSPAATRAKWHRLLARLRRAPVTVGSAVITYAGLVGAVNELLDVVQPHATAVTNGSLLGWPGTAQILQRVWQARGRTAGATPAAAPPAAAAQPYLGDEQMLSVACGDNPSPPAKAFPRLQRLVLRRAGVIGLPNLWGDEPCATWPVHQDDTYRGPWNAPTPPILVIGNTTDPATPLKNAIAMTRELASARLLVVHGYGHTVFLNPSTCASSYMTAYFRTGALPPKAPYASKTSTPSPDLAGNPRSATGEHLTGTCPMELSG
jgi:pimeloyl-ACP methyl ester carboxylesterase